MVGTLFLVGCCPPPSWIVAQYEDCVRENPGSVSVLLWGEGVYNPSSLFPGAMFLRRDLEGRGMSPEDRALSDAEAARTILGAGRVLTCS